MSTNHEEKKEKRPRPGQPSKLEQISIQELCEIILKYAANGWFMEQMPAAIWQEKKVKVSYSWLNHLQDEQFLQTKSLAQALISRWYTEMMLQAAIPSAPYIFIQKNVIKWTDNRNVTLEAVVDNKESNQSKEERQARIELIKKMAKESGK